MKVGMCDRTSSSRQQNGSFRCPLFISDSLDVRDQRAYPKEAHTASDKAALDSPISVRNTATSRIREDQYYSISARLHTLRLSQLSWHPVF